MMHPLSYLRARAAFFSSAKRARRSFGVSFAPTLATALGGTLVSLNGRLVVFAFALGMMSLLFVFDKKLWLDS